MLTLEDLRRRFVSEVSTGKSVDWYLIKLSSVVAYLKDFYEQDRVAELLHEFLNSDVVVNALKPLACYVDVVSNEINMNPRFKDLRTYSNEIIEFLNSLECSGKELTTVVRNPTFKVDESTPYEVKVKASRIRLPRIKAMYIGGRGLLKIIAIAVLASLITYVAYVVIKSIHNIPATYY